MHESHLNCITTCRFVTHTHTHTHTLPSQDYGGLRALIDDAAARTATAAVLERATQKHNSDGSDDPFCIAAETATAAAAAAAAALEAEHVGREAVEAKLREARGGLDSKNARIKCVWCSSSCWLMLCRV